LVVSKAAFNQHGHSILAMITSGAHQPWPGDTPVTQLKTAGLHQHCLVRLKLFTLDNRLILKAIGRLAPSDRNAVEKNIETFLI